MAQAEQLIVGRAPPYPTATATTTTYRCLGHIQTQEVPLPRQIALLLVTTHDRKVHNLLGGVGDDGTPADIGRGID